MADADRLLDLLRFNDGVFMSLEIRLQSIVLEIFDGSELKK